MRSTLTTRWSRTPKTNGHLFSHSSLEYNKLFEMNQNELIPEMLKNKKYVLWNVYVPNTVAFHTPLSKYLTVIVKVKVHSANQNFFGGFLSDLYCVQYRISTIFEIFDINDIFHRSDGED